MRLILFLLCRHDPWCVVIVMRRSGRCCDECSFNGPAQLAIAQLSQSYRLFEVRLCVFACLSVNQDVENRNR